MPGGARRGAGRKPLEIDFEQLEKLASLQCTDREFAAFFRCTTRTIEKRRKEPAFKEALERGKSDGPNFDTARPNEATRSRQRHHGHLAWKTAPRAA